MFWSLPLKSIVKRGDLTVIDASGKTHRYGNAAEPRAAIRLHDKALHWQLALNPGLRLGEAYMDGTLTLEGGTALRDFLTVLAINMAGLKNPLPEWLTAITIPVRQRLLQHNAVSQAKKNVAPHYDLSDKLYELFLDPGFYYSCAYYTDPANSLEQAQADKVRHICAKLRLGPGMSVLDIGSGWGGLAIHIAREFGAQVTGVSLSGEQVAEATRRAAAAGVGDRVRFLQQDVRTLDGQFDRIVSVGMLEHIGVGFYRETFDKMRALLKLDGIALAHFIGSLDGPHVTNPWLRKYIFPGGYAPALSEISRPIEKSGLFMTDIELLRLHYAYTLRDWHARFQAQRHVAAQLYDERFCRMWEFYLVGCEMEFLYMGTGVYQIQLSRDINVPPITRDYMIEAERMRHAPP